MICPRFEIATGSAYGEGWIAFTDDDTDRFGPFEWAWTGGAEVHVYAYYGDILEKQRTILVAGPHGHPVIARTPQAFAAFLAGHYSTPEAIQALVEPWEAEQARYRQHLRRHVRRIRWRAWLHWRLLRSGRSITPRRPG